MTEKSCYVYLFYYPDISTKNPNKPNAVKIGISGNPKSRLKNLNHSYPGEILIEYIKKFETRAEATNAERFLHNFFNKDRAKYEFFYLNIDDCKKKIIEKFGEGDDINKLENQNKNKTFRVPSYMKLAEENKIDKPAEYSQKSKYENFFNSLNDKVSPFRSDPSVNINMREVLRKKARERNIHLYDRIQNPLSGLYYDKPYSFGFKIDEVLNSFYEEHPMVKNEYFSEFLVTVSDHMGWELREAKDYEEKNSKFWGHVGSGDREKEFRSKKEILKFHKKISNGPNILTCIDVLISMREWHAMDCDTLTKDPDQPTEYLLPPPVGYLLGEHPLMGKTVNFFLLSDDWLNDQESFGRTVPTYRHPCRKNHLAPLFFLFDLHGYAPFITYINKPFGHNIFYQCEIESAIGDFDFSDETSLYRNCMGMTQEKAFEYHESNLNNMGYDVDWTRGMGWDV